MNRGNMGKQISSAPKSKKVKKMFGGGTASLPPRTLGMQGGPAVPRTQSAMMQAAAAGTPRMLGMQGGPAVPRTQSAMMQAVKGMRPQNVRGMAKGGKIDGCCMKGKTKGKMC